MKILMVTFSDNADHQDTTFGMYEELQKDKEFDTYLLAIRSPKVSLQKSDHTWLVDCPTRPGICKKTFDIFLISSVIRRIKKEKFDAIYFESLHVWNLPIMMAVKGKTHIFHVIHDVIPHRGDKAYRKVDLFNKLLVRMADTIVLRNKKYISYMHSHYLAKEDQVKYLGLWRRYPGYTQPSYSHKVLFFGRMNPYKGIDNLLQIVKKCPGIQFDIIGKVDPQVQDIVDMLEKEPNTTIKTGYVSDNEMMAAFIGCDWTIVPYASASQSGIIIDSYKYSRPVIAFDVGAISEQIADKQSGFLIPAGDISAFSACLKELVNCDKEQYNMFSKKAYEFGSMKYAAVGQVESFKHFIKESL
ncbi:glycosyltransferase family 4 protein [uncultured Acidaminococcus sp.]|uniref:glycosyltransferase family 4 protein n=1 Tax=uncultured Acidaminococcus sp. TaxID=352152 RepID=UPI0026DCDD5D|nr:glycosyltransferase family 4 protein [uncultured Acidaminococcus sp.]